MKIWHIMLYSLIAALLLTEFVQQFVSALAIIVIIISPYLFILFIFDKLEKLCGTNQKEY